MKLTYTIPGRPITKKNSPRLVVNRGRPRLLPSAAYKAYESAAWAYLRPKPEKPIDFPVNVCGVYYMPDARNCDLTNLLEGTMDILVKYGVLADDNYKIAASHDGSYVTIDRKNPRAEITITERSTE